MEIRLKITTHLKLEFDLDFDKALVTALLEAAERHYDSAAKEAAREGGFIYTWKYMLEYDENLGLERFPVSATWRQLDLILKICEWIPRHLTDEQHMMLYRMCASIHRVMNRSSEFFKEKLEEFNQQTNY